MREWLKHIFNIKDSVEEVSEEKGLSEEHKSLREELDSLTTLKNEYLDEIEAFNRTHDLKLGAIIQKILQLKTESVENLESSKSFDFDIEKLKEEISQTEVELDEIKENETFQTIRNIEDMDNYFEVLQKELEEEYQRLKEGV